MSLFKVSVVARNTKDETRVSVAVDALVDTGSELTWLPRQVLEAIGIAAVRKRNFSTATQQVVTRETGYVILTAEGFETVDEVVFGEPGDLSLLGVRTIEGFGVMVDNVAHRFVATSTIVA
jgi:predicted aspartyl protease